MPPRLLIIISMFVNTVYGQLTNGQAFNYNANDIIYKEFNYGAAYVLDTIKTKSFSTTSDTIYYVIKSTQYYKTNPNANWSITLQ